MNECSEWIMLICMSFQCMKKNSQLSWFYIISSYNEVVANFLLWDQEHKNACISSLFLKIQAKIRIKDETASREYTS